MSGLVSNLSKSIESSTSAAAPVDDLYQIALLIDQLKHDDSALRVNAANNLVRIATALGPERARDELIPFLCESTDDEDDVLRAITERLGEMVPCMGGDEYVHILLEPLETLSNVEESSVRNAAIKSIGAVVQALPNEHMERYFAPFVLRLASQDWFTCRISAASLFPIGYGRLTEKDKASFKLVFIRLCSDDTPLVRRVVAQNFGEMAAKMNPSEITPDLLSAFDTLARDDQDSVRIQSISSAIVITGCLSLSDRINRILPLISAAANDKSWRVRWSLASQLHELCGALGEQAVNRTMGTLAAVFEGLLSDSEAEVRAAASAGVSLLCNHLPKDVVISRVLPVVQRLVTDSSEHVRASLANVVNDLAVALGKQDTVEHLLPVLLLFLRDETSEVRLNIISNLNKINTVIGVELLSQALLPAIVDLAEDTNWRVRSAIIEHIPMLAQRLGNEFFSEKLNVLCLTWLTDTVFSVRSAAIETLPKLVTLFGDDWAKEQILPQLDKMHVNTNYLQRMTSLYSVQHLSPVLSVSVVESLLLPMVLEMVTDAVPNVRFTVARTLLKMKGKVQSVGLAEQVTGVLHKMSEDTDRDVRFYSMQVSNK